MTDITCQAPRTYTHPDVFTAGWAEPETDPTRIDWAARQAAAAIPFEVTGGRPVNPREVTAVRYGRNELGRWGENLMADALVTVSCGCRRYLLMVERGDGYGWAVPGGSVEPGETAVQAAARELAEETGLAVPLDGCRAAEPLYVPDPRASDEAWAVTIPVQIDLGQWACLPVVVAADDARRAAWVPADSYSHVVVSLDLGHDGGRVFAAHTAMLTRLLAAPGHDVAPGRAAAAAALRAVAEVIETRADIPLPSADVHFILSKRSCASVADAVTAIAAAVPGQWQAAISRRSNGGDWLDLTTSTGTSALRRTSVMVSVPAEAVCAATGTTTVTTWGPSPALSRLVGAEITQPLS